MKQTWVLPLKYIPVIYLQIISTNAIFSSFTSTILVQAISLSPELLLPQILQLLFLFSSIV